MNTLQPPKVAAPTPASIATVTGLTVRYGSKTAVEDLTVTVPGGCVGLLGPNGAGKTTLIKSLMGFLKPASGSGSVLGMDIGSQGIAIRRRVGLMPESDCHIPGMNAVTFVAYCGELTGMPADQALRRAHEVLEYCGLGEERHRAIETYSTGMKQRIKLAQAIVHGPALLFLDEPTNGLDPEGRDDLLQLVHGISHGKGVNVIVSSHLLPDIERTCDSVIVMRGGKLAEVGSVADLKKTEGDLFDVELASPSEPFIATLIKRGGAITASMGSRCRVLLPPSATPPAETILRSARETGAQVRSLSRAQRSLEDIFLEAIV